MMKLLLPFILILSGCLKGVHHDKTSSDEINAELAVQPPRVDKVTVFGDRIDITGDYLANATSVRVTGPGVGNNMGFLIKVKNRLLVQAQSPINFAIDQAYKLVVTNAFGQANFPFTFSLNNDSVASQHIQDGAVTLQKLSTAGALDGQVLKYDGFTGNWIFASDAGAGAPGTGTVTDIILGTGLIPGVINVSGTVSVNTGTTGDPSDIKIPYFDNSNNLTLDETAKLKFTQASRDFSLFNDGSLRVHDETDGVDRFILDGLGNITIPGALNVTGALTASAGKAVCLFDGTNCPAAVVGGDLDDLTVEAGVPYNTTLRINGTVGGNFTTGSGTISVNVGTGANQIVQLDATGKLPAVDGSLVTGVAPGGAAGGALQGTYPNPTLAASSVGQLQIAGMGAVAGQVLSFDGAIWGPSTPAGLGTLTGLSVEAGAPLNNTLRIDGVVGGSFNNGSGTISVNTGTAANQIVQLDGAGKLPAVDGSQLTNVSASNVWSVLGTSTYYDTGGVIIGNNVADYPTAELVISKENEPTTLILESNTDAGVPSIVGYRSRGDRTAKTVPSSGNVLMAMSGFGYDGAQYLPGAAIVMLTDAGAGLNDMPGRIIFKTTPDGAAAEIEQMRLDSSGNLSIGTTSNTDSKLYVRKDGVGLTANADANTFVIEQTSGTGAGMSILSSTTSPGNIYFGDSVLDDAGKISYDHTADTMTFHTLGSVTSHLAIDNSGRIGFGPGNNAPVYDVEFRKNEVGTISSAVVNESTAAAASAQVLVQSGPNAGIESAGFMAAYPAAGSFPNAVTFESSSTASGVVINAPGAAQTIQLHTNAGEAMRVTNGGLLGIGLTVPLTKTHVYQEDNRQNDHTVLLTLDHAYDAGFGANGIGVGIRLNAEDSAGESETAAMIIGRLTEVTSGSEEGSLSFRTKNGATLTEKMEIDTNGFVGIGTAGAGPSTQLHVRDDDTTGTMLRLDNFGVGGEAWTLNSEGSADATYAGSLTFENGAANKMALTTNGDLKLGADTVGAAFPPSAKLDITGALGFQSSITNTDPLTAISSIPVAGEIMGYGNLGFANDGGLLRLSAGGGNDVNRKTYIDIIGSSTTAAIDQAINMHANKYNLNVIDGIGGTIVGMSIDNAGNVDMDQNLNVDGVFSNPSDVRFKKDIRPLNTALETISKLSPVEYYWKQEDFPQKNFNGQKQYGFIAL